AELGGVPGRNDRAEGVAQEREPVELQGSGEQIDVAGEDLEAERRRVDALRTALASFVDVEEPVLVSERVEIGPEHRVVESRPAVENDQRKAAADLFDVEVVAVRQRDLHPKNPKPGRIVTRL